MIIKCDYRIASVTDGYGLLLRNKQLNDVEHRLPGNSVLFIHPLLLFLTEQLPIYTL